MNQLFPFLAAAAIGYLILSIIYRRKLAAHDPLEWVIAFWLGAGACVLITFSSFMIAGFYNPLLITASTSILLVVLSGLYLKRCKLASVPLSNRTMLNRDWLKLLLLIVMAWGLMQGIAVHNPYGDWDAWSFWNFRSRYLVNAGVHWQDIFTFQTQGKHPWFLPFWTVFGWAWSGIESEVFARLSAQVFTVLLITSVFVGIGFLSGQWWLALLGSLWLISIPYFITHSISQYADVLVASLIAINMLFFLRLMMHAPSKADAIVFGLLLGILAFVKDEGIVSVFIFVLLLSTFRNTKNFYLPFILSLYVSLIPTIIVKCWMMPAPAGENIIGLSGIVELNRIQLIISHFGQVLTGPMYGGVIVIPIMLIFLKIGGFWDKIASRITQFLFIFIAFFFLLYLGVANDLPWRLAATSQRLVYEVLPLVIILLFYCLPFGTKK